jgi:stress-induced morphogen
MWRRVDIVLTDVSEERIASIFRVEEKRIKSASKEPARADAQTYTYFTVRISSSRFDLIVWT